jgi:DNA-binding LytR/AlgR family response regulator
MLDSSHQPLRGMRVLIVEDEYVVASDLVRLLKDVGAMVAGPVASVGEALLLVTDGENGLDAAVLDVNLHGERVFPVADALADRGVPVVFTTGYDESVIPAAYASVPRCEKPVDHRALVGLLALWKAR